MITKMKKYTFLVFHRDYEHFLEQLRDAGVLHVNQKAAGAMEDEQLQQQLSLVDRIRKAVAISSSLIPEGCAAVDTGAAPEDAEALLMELPALTAEKQQLEQDLITLQKEQTRMKVWGSYSSERIEALQAAGYELRYFVCPKSKYQPEWETMHNAFLMAEEAGMRYFVTVNKQGTEVDIDAEEITLNKHNADQLNADIEALKGLVAAKQAQLEAWAIAHTGELREAEHRTMQTIDWKQVNLSTTQLADDTLCLLEGFCPIDAVEDLNRMLDEQHIYYVAEDPTEEDNTPVKLRNNWFTRMFECLTGMYGWPVYGEFDPTPILGPFFLLFFAMCMGDAGYGIILILFGILTTKRVLKIEMFDGLGPLITTLGIGTLVVGFFLGTFFGIDLYAASWVPESLKSVMIKGKVAGFDIQMVLALAIGVFHICLAMIIKAVCYTKRFGFKQNISTWGWLLLILGGLVIAVLALTEVFSAEVTKWALIGVGVVSALGIYIFNTPGRNPLINIGAGLWDTYNMATGILGDVLSYIRLYALGLAGGMLGAAFNKLGLMILGENPNVGTWLGFIVILIFGHVLNVCMSALGAFVHPLRLSFVEYFKNSGYEGKGHLYKPFAK